MIAFFDKEDIVAHESPVPRVEIATQWKSLLEKEKKLRLFMKAHSADEPFIGLYSVDAWVSLPDVEDTLGFFFKQLAKMGHQDIYIFYYHDDGYVAFGGQNSTSILTLFNKIEMKMYAACMRTLMEKL